MTIKNKDQEARAKDVRDFIITWTAVLITCPLLSFIFFPDRMKEFFVSSFLQEALKFTSIWLLIGIAAYMNCSFKETLLGRHTTKFFILLIFFAPTLSVFLFGPSIEKRMSDAIKSVENSLNADQYYFDEFHNKVFRRNSGSSQRSAPFIPSPDAKPVFFARREIPKDCPITANKIEVKSVDLKDFPDAIIATKENYFGEPGSKESILSAKTKKIIKAGELIQQSDLAK